MTAVPGVVLGREGSRLRVLAPTGEVVAVLRGKMKRGPDTVVAGDTVRMDAGHDGIYGITGVAPRRNVIRRRLPETQTVRTIAANLDHVFVLTAAAHPDPIPQLIDRLLVIAEADDIPASVIVNKTDLAGAGPIGDRMRRAGYEVHEISAKEGRGLDALFARLHHGVNLLVGPSGAGKSTLLNALQPGLALPTAEVSAKVRRGRNTTVSAVMAPLHQGGYLVDTPGLSDVGVADVDPRELAQCFPDLRPFIGACRFADCRHVNEPGCAIRGAVGRGVIATDRFASYLGLLEEIENEPPAWQ